MLGAIFIVLHDATQEVHTAVLPGATDNNPPKSPSQQVVQPRSEPKDFGSKACAPPRDSNVPHFEVLSGSRQIHRMEHH